MMFRNLRKLLAISAGIALVWLIRAFITVDTVSPLVLIVILGLLLAVLLIRKISRQPRREVELPPSQRKRAQQHKSWISRIDRD